MGLGTQRILRTFYGDSQEILWGFLGVGTPGILRGFSGVGHSGDSQRLGGGALQGFSRDSLALGPGRTGRERATSSG